MNVETFGLSFDSSAAYNALVEQLVGLADGWGQIIANTADVNVEYYDALRGAITHEVYQEVGQIIADIFPEGEMAWQGWLEEFGKGSLMDTSNEYLSEYRNSAMWNRLRQDTEIAGRAKGRYLGIDGIEHESGGLFAGKNLEQLSLEPWFQLLIEENGWNGNPFAPTPPTHFLRNALLSNRDKIEESLRDLIANFDWSAYLR